MMNNILEKLISELASMGVSSPRLEARMIIAHILGLDADSYFSLEGLSAANLVEISNIMQRRRNHEPLDKILGHKDFYKHRFAVSCDVLSPRPDSEVLVEEAVNIARQNKFTSILELGVGSGCLILSVLADVPNMTGRGLDKSEAALKMALLNAEKLVLSDRVELIEADYFDYEIKDKFDMIITNPPYIPSLDVLELEEEVKNFDPKMALDGGEDGFDHYKKIADLVPELLNDGGYLLVEAGINQAEEIKSIFIKKGLDFVLCKQDLGGIERCIIFKKA